MISEKLNIRHATFQILVAKRRCSLDIYHLWQVWNCVLKKHKCFGQIDVNIDTDTHADMDTDLDILPVKNRPRRSSWISDASHKMLAPGYGGEEYECQDFNAFLSAGGITNHWGLCWETEEDKVLVFFSNVSQPVSHLVFLFQTSRIISYVQHFGNWKTQMSLGSQKISSLCSQ